MKYMWAAVIVLCLTASVSFAQLGIGITARAQGMGSTGIGVANDNAAWFQNPAGLGAFGIAAKEGNSWANDINGTFATNSEDVWGFTWSGAKSAANWGVGAGYLDYDGGSVFGAGAGMQWKDTPLSLGLNVVRFDEDEEILGTSFGEGSATLVNLGLMYRFEQEDKAPIRVGVVALDVADEWGGPVWGAGVLWPATAELGIAVDVIDIFDRMGDGALINAGAEYAFRDDITGRIGVVDEDGSHALTLGAGYKWGDYRLDAAWQDLTGDSLWAFSASKAW